MQTRIRLIRKPRCVDGVDVSEYAVGDSFDLGWRQAQLLVAEGWAVLDGARHREADLFRRRAGMRLRLTLPVALRLSTYAAFRKKSTADNSLLVETAASRTASFKNGTTNRRERFADRKTKVDVLDRSRLSASVGLLPFDDGLRSVTNGT